MSNYVHNVGRTRSGRVFCGLLCAAVIVIGLVVVRTRQAPADLAKARAADRHVTSIVRKLLDDEHLSRHPLDDEISQRAMKSYLEMLDPAKMYFQKSDIEQFMVNRDHLDDFVKTGNISVAHDIFNRFLERSSDRLADVETLIDTDHDFTVDEDLMIKADDIDYAANDAEAFERWRKRIKYEFLVRKAEKMELEEAKEKIRRRYQSFAKRKTQTDSDELLEMFLSSVTTAFDPHTTYMAPSTLDNFHIAMKLNLEGIGASLQFDDGYTVVHQVIPGGAADRHGKLKPEDRIVSVGQGTEGEMVDVVDMKLSDVVKLIRGRADTIVRLGVIPAGENETKVYRITRARIELKDSEARGEVIEDGDRGDGTPVKIGVINLPSFYMDMMGARLRSSDYKSTTRDVRRILTDFRKKGVDVVVLDLRRNGGGSLTEAINLTGLFIDKGPVVQVKDADGRVQLFDDLDRGMAWEGPLVVLTSKFSASASEILAGAIQDYRRGVIVGDESTHGKGTVQSLLDLGERLFYVPDPPNLGALKITMQQFYRPNGDSTQRRGVLADLVLPSLTSQMDVGESDLDYAIEFDRLDAANFDKVNLVNMDIVKNLQALSAARIKESEDFDKLATKISKYREQKERKTVSLQEDEFFEDRKDVDAEKEEEEQFKDQVDNDRPVFERNYYNNEVLEVAKDYVELLQRQRLAQAG